MTAAVVFGFAVADGLLPVAGAAPWDVLSRQLPRLLVGLLNGDADRGARFFPFLGNEQGRRGFLRLRDVLPAETLAGLHRQGDIRVLVDGQLQASTLRLRVLDGSTLRAVFEGELPFDPSRPTEVLPRAQFEVMGALGWQGRPMPLPALAGESLAWLLVGKDALLALEANLLESAAADPVRAMQRIAQLAPGDAEAQALVVELGVQSLRHGLARSEIAAAVAAMAAATSAASGFQQRAADLLQACGDDAGATAVLLRTCDACPERSDLAERAVGLLFRQQRLAEARTLLERSRAAGHATPALLAQMAAVADRQGDRALRGELCAQLLQLPAPSGVVARLLINFLIDDDRSAAAIEVADRAIRVEPGNGALRVDRARALLLLDQPAAAAESLRAALALGLSPQLRAEAERLQQMCREQGLVPSIQVVEAALREGRNGDAGKAARALVRRSPSVAEAWLLLGVLHHRMAHPRRAERALRKAIALRDDLGEAHNRLGILLVDRRRLDEGHRHLQRAVELMPNEASPRIHRAQALALLGRQGEARAELAAAERFGGDSKLLAAVRQKFFAGDGA